MNRIRESVLGGGPRCGILELEMDDLHGDAAAVAPDGLRSSADWSRIEREFLAAGDAAAAHAGVTQLTDGAVAEAYRATIGALFPHASAALAVGEYGRRELAPGSGAEILILFEAESEIGRASCRE